MECLAIDTTKNELNIILSGNINDEITINDIKQSEFLLTNIENILIKNNLYLYDLDCFCCVTGPGSFTGIRVGIATIKGLNKSLNKKLLSLNIFDIVRYDIVDGFFITKCTNTSVYYAEIEACSVIDYGVIDIENINSFLGNKKIYIFDNETFLKDITYTNIILLNNYKQYLKKAINKRIKENTYISTLELKPFYIQLSQAERQLKKKENSNE